MFFSLSRLTLRQEFAAGQRKLSDYLSIFPEFTANPLANIFGSYEIFSAAQGRQ
jgi:hypothetical protein